MTARCRIRRGAIVVGARLSLLTALAVVSVASGCTSQDSKKPPGSSPAVSSSTEGIPPAPEPGVGDVSGAKGDLSDEECQWAGGTWSFSAKLINSRKKKQTYAVRVAIVDAASSSVVNAQVFEHSLAAGDSLVLDEPDFAVSEEDGGLNCIVSVTRSPG